MSDEVANIENGNIKVITVPSGSGNTFVILLLIAMLVISMASAGYFIFLYSNKDSESDAFKELVKKQNEIFEEQIKTINAMNQELQEAKDEIKELSKKQDAVRKENKQKKEEVDRILPKEEEDIFFAEHGFTASYRSNAKGRFFPDSEVQKIQVLVVENEGLKRELAVAQDVIASQGTMMEKYEKQIKNYEGTFLTQQELVGFQHKEIQELRKDVRNSKIKKWMYVVGAFVIIGAAHASSK